MNYILGALRKQVQYLCSKVLPWRESTNIWPPIIITMGARPDLHSIHCQMSLPFGQQPDAAAPPQKKQIARRIQARTEHHLLRSPAQPVPARVERECPRAVAQLIWIQMAGKLGR